MEMVIANALMLFEEDSSWGTALTLAIVGAVLFFLLGSFVYFAGSIFIARWKKQVVARPVLHGVWLLVFFVLMIEGLLLKATPPRSSMGWSKQARAKEMISQLHAASRSYFHEYGTYPTSNNAELIKVFRSANPGRLVFFTADPRYLNQRGELIDPWGTPYRISGTGTNELMFRSAGPNRVIEEMEGSDDVGLW